MYTKIPEWFIDELKEKTNLVQLAKEYTTLKKVGTGVWQGNCPHPKHNDDTPSFTVWQKHNSWACYGCHSGKKGVDGNLGSDAIAFIQWIENLEFRQAIKFLADWNDLPMPTDKNQKLFDNNSKLSYKYHKDLYKNEQVLDYLYDRGLDDTDISNWYLGYDYHNKRIVFPLFNKYKNIVGFNKRVDVADFKGSRKYINSENSEIFNKSKYFYGIHNLDKDFNEIRITEGSMDVILGHKYGAKNVVATLGTAFTETHAKMIAKTGKTPVIIFDGDGAGDKGLTKALAYFDALGIYCKIVKLPIGKDLADLSLDLKFGLENYIRNNSITAGYYKIRNIINSYKEKLYTIQLEYIPELDKIISDIPKAEEKPIKRFVKSEMNIDL